MMRKNKGTFTLIGFLVAGIGLLALILSLVGVQLAFLTWIDAPGKLFGFLIRLIMILIGFIVVVLAQTNYDKEEV